MSLGVQAQVEPKAENRLMRLDQAGAGLWAQLGRPDAAISRVTLAGNPGQMLYLQFVLAAGGKRELSGRLEQKDAYTVRIRITNSGSADAGGSILIDYGAKNSINTLLGSGLVDGQPFTVQFTRRAPLQLNSIALGTGTWAQTGSEATQVQRVSCFQDSALQAEAAFFLADGQTRRVAGRVERKLGSRKIRLMLSKSGMANATGELTIQLGRKNRIASVDGDFQIDGQPVRVHFESAPSDQPLAALRIDATLASLKKVEGNWTQGDVSTTYTAYIDDMWIKRIDSSVKQGDDRSSPRRLYFDRDQLSLLH